jgi:hypothetical protein
MKNSVLLKIAVGLCIANVFFALWSSWSASRSHSRLVAAERSIQESEKSIQALRSSLASETTARESESKALGAELKVLSQLVDRVIGEKPPGK